MQRLIEESLNGESQSPFDSYPAGGIAVVFGASGGIGRALATRLAAIARAFAVNAIGPALLMKHFLPLLPRAGRCVALHPGTVATSLSERFAKQGLTVQSPDTAAMRILTVLNRLTPTSSGEFFDQRGRPIIW